MAFGQAMFLSFLINWGKVILQKGYLLFHLTSISFCLPLIFSSGNDSTSGKPFQHRAGNYFPKCTKHRPGCSGNFGATAPPPEALDTTNMSDTQELLDVENEAANKSKKAESREIWETFSWIIHSAKIRWTRVLIIKGACSHPQPPSPTFFRHMEILVPNLESYLEGFICKKLCAKPV